jgi:hypothetical protein
MEARQKWGEKKKILMEQILGHEYIEGDQLKASMQSLAVKMIDCCT